jgi:hypothetical protein
MSFPELIKSQEELLTRLLLVSQRQLEIVELGSPSVLVDYLGQRERLWHEFEVLDRQLAPHKGIPLEQRPWQSADERQTTESALNRCEELLKQILANDEMSFTKLAEQKEKAEKDLRRVRLSMTAVPAYARQSQLATPTSSGTSPGEGNRAVSESPK